MAQFLFLLRLEDRCAFTRLHRNRRDRTFAALLTNTRIPLGLDKSHYRLADSITLVLGIFLYPLRCNDLEGIVHDTLALTEHDNLVDYLAMGSPFFRQVQLRPIKVVQILFLQEADIAILAKGNRHLPNVCSSRGDVTDSERR